MEEKNVPNHIYIVDRETNKIAAEAINGHSLFQIQQLESAGKFDQEYFVQITPDDRSEDEDAWLGFYPAAWDPYILEDVVSEACFTDNWLLVKRSLQKLKQREE